MVLSQLESLVYSLTGDLARKRDQGYVDLLLNLGASEFNKATGIFRSRAQVAIVNGVGKLNAIPDSLNLQGRILRVEDANNGNKGLTQTTENSLDVIEGAQWRQNTQGALRSWYRGTPNEGTQDGYGTIGVYPCAASGLINVFYIGTPKKLIDDSTVSDIPDHFQIAQAWYAIKMILSAEKDQSMAGQLELASTSYEADVARAGGEVATFTTKMGG